MYKQTEKKTSPFCLYQKITLKNKLLSAFLYTIFFSSTLLMCYLDF